LYKKNFIGDMKTTSQPLGKTVVTAEIYFCRFVDSSRNKLWNPPFVDLSRNKLIGSTVLLTQAGTNLRDPSICRVQQA
jgi:hypothetical protein